MKLNSVKRKIAVIVHLIPNFELYYGTPSAKDKQIKKLANSLLDTVKDVYFTYYSLKDGDGNEYIALTDAEADAVAREYIDDNMGRFKASWLATIFPFDEEWIEDFQDGDTDELREILKDSVDEEKWEDIIDTAISIDGRTHFINTYDGKEYGPVFVDGTEMYIYRVE